MTRIWPWRLAFALAIVYASSMSLVQIAVAAPTAGATEGGETVARQSVSAKGPISARLTFASAYREGGDIDVILGIRSKVREVGVGCLDYYHDFSYRLTDKHGDVVQTYNLSNSVGLGPLRNPRQCDEHEWIYDVPLSSIYPSVPPGTYDLIVTVGVEGAPATVMPSVPIFVSGDSGTDSMVRSAPITAENYSELVPPTI